MKTIFLRLLESDDKAAALMAALTQRRESPGWARFEVDPMRFAAIPRSPFAYWITESIRNLHTVLPRLETSQRQIVSGGKTLDDFRWIRLYWETALISNSPWVGFAKGGSFSPFYFDVYLQLDWRDDGRSLKAYLISYRESRGWSPNWTAELHGSSYYLRPGLTWPRRTDGLSVRPLPKGCVFADKGPAAFVRDDDMAQLLSVLAVMNSEVFRSLVSLQLARTELAQSYEVGILQRVPFPNLSPGHEKKLAVLARRAWTLKRNLDTSSETSHAFILPAVLQVEGKTLGVRAATWDQQVRQTEAELEAIQSEIDDDCFSVYGIADVDSQAMAEGLDGNTHGSEPSREEEAEANGDDEAEAVTSTDTGTLVADLVSWTVGAAFGRFDVRLATGGRPLPTEPEPFDPLPVCSPGMLTGDDGLPLAGPSAGYPLSFPTDGILIDDPGHPRDLAFAVRAVFDVVFGMRADAFWQETAVLLDPRDHDLRRWLASRFFDHHLRRYSRSHRKAPILWELCVPSGRYSVWCYAQRMTRDSLLAIQNDVVAPKLTHEERRLSGLFTQVGKTPTAGERAEIADQEAFVEELRILLDEIRRVAPLWNPDLDDGVVLVMAPLWRLVPTHRAWQRDLRSKWEELVAGKYDWAHIAMHFWPERVVPKCATDRSLAIVHDLEDVFWLKGDDGKWTRRPAPTRPIEELVAERTSPAVKAAFSSLLEAPEPAGGGRRRRRNAGVPA